MQSTIDVIEPAKDIDLVTLYAAKVALNVGSSTTQDDLISQFITFASDKIATTCNRVFAERTVIETFLEVDDQLRIFLSQWPVNLDKPFVVEENGIELIMDTDYDVDVEKGRLTRFGAMWTEPVIVTYTGGYDLPHKAPPALQQAALLGTREAYFLAIRGDSSIRSVSHKESRVMFFDPNTALKSLSGGSSGASPAQRAIDSLLAHYMRIEA